MKSWYIGLPPWIKLRVVPLQRGYKVRDSHDSSAKWWKFRRHSHWHQLREVGVFSDRAAFAGFAAHCALVVWPWEMRAVRSAVDLRSAVADSDDPGTSSSQRGHRELFSSPTFFKISSANCNLSPIFLAFFHMGGLLAPVFFGVRKSIMT